MIDLPLAHPLGLEFDANAVSADLTFDGDLIRCVFPYASVYIVADRDTGEGIVIDENVPVPGKKAIP